MKFLIELEAFCIAKTQVFDILNYWSLSQYFVSQIYNEGEDLPYKNIIFLGFHATILSIFQAFLGICSLDAP